jgi:uncharacterized repeat protein (TIGR01451 family)
MGNGPWSGRRSGGSLERNLGNNSGRCFAFGAMLALVLAGSVLLWSGSRRSEQHAAVQLPVSPIATSFTSSMPNKLRSNSRRSKPDARAILGQLPLIFEPNQGQADPQVKFLARGAGYSLFLDATGAMLAIPTTRSERFVRMKLVGANAAAVTAGSDPLPGKSNYIFGNDPHKWHTGIPQFAGVHYQSVYRGIDLVFYGNQGRLEYDFRVAPGANPAQAELQFDGASKLEVSDGDLILTGKDEGGLRLQAPRVYQRDGEREKPVAGRFVLRAANRVGFEVGPYDRSRELIIDPVLDFSSYFGGSGTETSPSVAVNGNGNIYIVGTTQGSPANTFPPAPQTLIGPLSLTTSSPSHIFVAEISPSQPPSVVYETFIGGTGSDSSVGIAVDGSGDAFIVGNTTSTDFPTVGVFYQSLPEPKTQCTGLPSCTSIVVSELNPGGTALTYSSYVSGNGNDQASGMTIDLNADVFITGTTTSIQAGQPSTDTFPASQFTYQNLPKASLQFFVTKLNTNVPYPGSIAYSTYFGGNTPAPTTCGTAPCNVGGGIAVDGTGNIYFDGTTNFYNSGLGAYGNGQTEDFPILNAYQPCLDTPPPTVLSSSNPCSAPATSPYATDAFVAKINPNAAQTGAAQLLFSTYLGGSGEDSATSIAIDSGAANIYLTGSTNSPDFVLPTGSAPFDSCLNNSNPPGSTNACVTANTTSTDAYVARMSNPTLSTTSIPNFVPLNYFSYLGGSGNDSGLAIAVLDAANTTLGDAVVTGATSSTNFPIAPVPPNGFPIQSTLNGAQNAFFAQIDTTTTTGQTGVGSYVTYFGGNGVDRGTGIAVDPGLNSYFVGDTTSNVNLRTFNPIQSTLNGARNAFVVKLGTATDLCIKCVAPVISPLGTVSAGNQVTSTFTLANEGPDPATFVTVTGTVTSGATFISGTASSGTCSAPVQNVVTCQILTLQSGASSLVNFIVTPSNSGNYSVTATVTANNNTNTATSQSASFAAAGYTATITPPSRSVVAGQLAQYTVNVNPNGVFGANVSFACSALPSGATCNFTNSTLNLQNGAQSTTLNLLTTAQPVSTAGLAGWRRSLYALWVMVPGMVLLGWAAGGKGRGGKGKMNRLLGLLMLSLFFALLLLQPACSGSTTPVPVSGTPSGVYPLTVTATSGSFSQTVPFQLTVTP